MRELHDVQPAGHEVGGHRRQVREEIVEREQVAGRVQHRDGEVEQDRGTARARDGEVAHVRLGHTQVDAGRLRLGGRVRAHRR